MRLARRLRAVLVLLLPLFLFLILPYDHPIRLSVHFNLLRPSAPPRAWLDAPPSFPVTLDDDLAVVVKSGWGTRHRFPAWLEAHAPLRLQHLLLVADFASPPGRAAGGGGGGGGGGGESYNGKPLPVYDMVQEMKDSSAIPASVQAHHPRLRKHADMSAAIARGAEETAQTLAQSFGWELDALKFIAALELCYRRMPSRKWYLLVDDDTYILPSSLQLLLERLDPSRPYYLGNAVGDYRARFAHGGSAVILSHATMRHLFSRPDLVAAAHRTALEETWGDRQLAISLSKMGIYLNEAFTTFFNGEQPHRTKLRADRFCAPIISFHGLAVPADMAATGSRFRNHSQGVRWCDVWNILDAPALESGRWESGRTDWDHVGPLDEATMTVGKVKTAEACAAVCRKHAKTCLAWTWEAQGHVCHLSPWMIPGEKAEGKVSSINAPRARSMARQCRPLP